MQNFMHKRMLQQAYTSLNKPRVGQVLDREIVKLSSMGMDSVQSASSKLVARCTSWIRCFKFHELWFVIIIRSVYVLSQIISET